MVAIFDRGGKEEILVVPLLLMMDVAVVVMTAGGVGDKEVCVAKEGTDDM